MRLALSGFFYVLAFTLFVLHIFGVLGHVALDTMGPSLIVALQLRVDVLEERVSKGAVSE